MAKQAGGTNAKDAKKAPKKWSILSWLSISLSEMLLSEK